MDVVLDEGVSRTWRAKGPECLAEDGRVVIIAVQGGVRPNSTPPWSLRKRLTITNPRCAPARGLQGGDRQALRERITSYAAGVGRGEAGHPQHVAAADAA